MLGRFRRMTDLADRFRPTLWRLTGWLMLVCACTLVVQPQSLPAQAPEEKPAEETPPVEEENTDNLPALEQMVAPSAEKFLTETKFKDWLVLKKDKKVIEVLPLYGQYPRPGTMEAWDAAIKRGVPRGLKNEKRLRDALPYMNVTLDGVENPEYRILRKFVEEIIYYEDQLLQRVDEALDKKQVRIAYELLERLEQTSPTWAGADLRRQRLLFVDAGLRIDAGDNETALAILQELYVFGRQTKPPQTYPGLSEKLGEVTDALVKKALQDNNYRRARYFLERLRRMEERHRIVLSWAKDLEVQATEKIKLAEAAARDGKPAEAVDRIEEAARIWPQASQLFSVHREIFGKYQRLRVGTLEAPTEKGPVAFISPADIRKKSLTETRLFEPGRMDDNIVRFETRFFTEWEPANLGYSIQFRMLQHRGDWESQPAITAGAVVQTLAHRMNPKLPQYDARIASAIDFLSVSSPYEFRVNFRQAPLRPEALFAIPLELSGGTGSVAPNGQPSWPFYLHLQDSRNTIYRRSRPESPQSSERHIAEIIETKYDDYRSAVQGLLRGEVSMLPRITPADLKKFEQHGEFFLFFSPLPETHLLQFHPDSKWMANRALRRALVYSLNRQQVLDSVFMQDGDGRLGRLSAGPFASNSYASNPLVRPHRYDPILSYSLMTGAKTELKSLPTLKMICSADPQIFAAAKQMVDQWNKMFERLGLKVVLLDAPPPGTEAGKVSIATGRGANGSEPASAPAWDMKYEVIRMAEPLVELWSVLAQSNGTDITSLQHIPTWLRQELLILEQAGDMSSATETLHRLHKHIWSEVHVLPLWELNPATVIRKTFRGLPHGSLNTYQYQGIEGWWSESWVPRDRDLVDPLPIETK